MKKKAFALLVILCMPGLVGAELINVSVGKQASASSVWSGTTAGLAVDGVPYPQAWPWRVSGLARLEYDLGHRLRVAKALGLRRSVALTAQFASRGRHTRILLDIGRPRRRRREMPPECSSPS